MQRDRVKDILNRESAGGEVLVQGWVKTRRSSGAVSFLQVSDGSTLKDLQIVVERALPDFPLVESLNTGCSVSVTGELVESQGRGQKYEVKARQVELLGQADPEEYPLQKSAIPWSFCGRLPTCAPAPTPLALWPGCATLWPTPSTASFSNGAFNTSRRL